jgi:YgiT-type zinc finger domain-containing protein
VSGTCPLCGEGELIEKNDTFEVEHDGRKGVVILLCDECTVCGSELCGSEHSRLNKQAMIDFRNGNGTS